MIYQFQNLKTGTFISRPNRYIAKVAIDGKEETVHVHDPGRLKELLFEGNTCLVYYTPSPSRKTDWDMIAAQKGSDYVLIHSGYHRKIAEAILSDPQYTPFGQVLPYKAEVKAGESRLDFCLDLPEDQKIWLEVKGCSLSEEGIAKFPDAPTKRGKRHLETLMQLKKEGHRAAVLLLILSEASAFIPKGDTDPDFYETFYKAMEEGVEIYPVKVTFNAETHAFDFGGLIDILPKHSL